MTARIAPAVALASLALLGFAGPGHAERAPSRLLVTGDEYSLVLSRLTVRRGPALIQFLNRGEDPHDLRLRRIGGTVTRSISAVEAGDQRSLRAKLLPGRYKLWCSLADHAARGMRATLVVSR